MAAPTDPTPELKRTALAVKRGEKTYADLDDKTRGEVRTFLKTATTRDLRKLVENERVERAPYRTTTRNGRVRTF